MHCCDDLNHGSRPFNITLQPHDMRRCSRRIEHLQCIHLAGMLHRPFTRQPAAAQSDSFLIVTG